MPSPCEYITEQLQLDAEHKHGLSVLLEEAFSITDGNSYVAATFMGESIAFTEAAIPAITSKTYVAETLTLADVYTVRIAVSVAENLTLTAAFGQYMVVHVTESFALSEALSPVNHSQMHMGETLKVTESVVVGYTQTVSETLTLTNPAIISVFIGYVVNETLTLTDSFPVFRGVATRGIAEQLNIVDSSAMSVSAQAQVNEVLSLADDFWFRSQDQIAWQFNTETTALSWNTNYGFDSIAQFGNKVFAASKDGLYVLAGNDDAGVPISSSIKTGMMDFGEHHNKRIDGVYYGLRGSSMRLAVDVFGDSTTYTYDMPPKTVNSPGAGRVVPAKGLNSRYWRLTFENINGGDFDVDNVELDIAASKTRRL